MFSAQRVAKAMDTQCHAFTKHHTRCKKPVRNDKVCKLHTSYYEDWLTKHPPLTGWRLNLPEKEEYRFQIENGHVCITDSYLQTFRGRELHDYYEYLVHLPHLRWDANMNMVTILIVTFLRQLNFLDVDYYFGRMFQNPSFCPATFVARIILCLDIAKAKQVPLPDISVERKREVFAALLQHPRLEGWMYMYWYDHFFPKLRNGSNIHIFCDVLRDKKQVWLSKQQEKCTGTKDELLEVALHPSRVLDWYMDVERKNNLRRVFEI